MGMIHAIDKKGKSHDINIERIIEEFRSQTYDGQFDDTLKKLFVWMTYPIIDVNTNIGFVIADHIDEANRIISMLELQDKIRIDMFQTFNVYRVYDWLLTNNTLINMTTKDKTYIWSIIMPDGEKKRGLVVAKTHVSAKHIIANKGIDVNETLKIDLFTPNKCNFISLD